MNIEETVNKYIFDQYIDYGDLNDKAEKQIREALIYGLTQPQLLPVYDIVVSDGMNHKVGDKVIVTRNTSGHDFNIGEYVFITDKYNDLGGGYYDATNNEETWCVKDEELKTC